MTLLPIASSNTDARGESAEGAAALNATQRMGPRHIAVRLRIIAFSLIAVTSFSGLASFRYSMRASESIVSARNSNIRSVKSTHNISPETLTRHDANPNTILSTTIGNSNSRSTTQNITIRDPSTGTNSAQELRNTTRSWAALCAVMRDEDLYIDEWADHHLALGFERVHIYDAHPNFTLAQWYKKRQQRDPDSTIGIHLTSRVLPDEGKVQELVYGECIAHLRTLPIPPRWVMVLDADEFLVFRNNQYSNVVEFLTDHLHSGSLQINWIVMGTGNETKYRDEPVTKRFQYSISGGDTPYYTKAVAVLDHIVGWKVHYAFHKQGYGAIGMGGRPVGSGTHLGRCCIANGDTSVAAVYHYKYKSEEEFYYKNCVRGDIYKSLASKCEAEKPVAGDVFDDGAWQALTRLLPKYAALARTGRA